MGSAQEWWSKSLERSPIHLFIRLFVPNLSSLTFGLAHKCVKRNKLEFSDEALRGPKTETTWLDQQLHSASLTSEHNRKIKQTSARLNAARLVRMLTLLWAFPCPNQMVPPFFLLFPAATLDYEESRNASRAEEPLLLIWLANDASGETDSRRLALQPRPSVWEGVRGCFCTCLDWCTMVIRILNATLPNI